MEVNFDDTFKVRENDVIHFKSVVKFNSFEMSKIKIIGFKYTESIKKEELLDLKDITYC
jgi:hypothetical protein